MAEFVKVPAGKLRVGDRTKFGTGYEKNYRTVARIQDMGNGIVRVWHRETDERFYDNWGESYPVDIVKPDWKPDND